MQIALINPTPSDHYSPCIRMLTSYLKLHGHSVRQLFVPADQIKHRHEEAHIMQLAQTLIDDIVDLVKDAQVVGLSFMSCQFDIAVQVTRAIQKVYPDKFMVWGGFHPTTMPQQALEFVDAVCVGEGEHAMLELHDVGLLVPVLDLVGGHEDLPDFVSVQLQVAGQHPDAGRVVVARRRVDEGDLHCCSVEGAGQARDPRSLPPSGSGASGVVGEGRPGPRGPLPRDRLPP